MDFKLALILKQRPYVQGVNYRETSEFVKAIADAVSFARAAGGVAQILVAVGFHESVVDRYDIVRECTKGMLGTLEVAGENLTVTMEEADHESGILQLTITATSIPIK